MVGGTKLARDVARFLKDARAGMIDTDLAGLAAEQLLEAMVTLIPLDDLLEERQALDAIYKTLRAREKGG